MSRVFGAVSTDRITAPYATLPSNLSFAIWTYRTGSGGSSFGRWVEGPIGLMHRGAAPDANRDQVYSQNTYWHFTPRSLNAWHPTVVTLDASASNNDPLVYVAGGPASLTQVGSDIAWSPGAASWYIGNSAASNRGYAGRSAWFTIWNAILTADEAAAFCAGINPRLIRPGNIVECLPLWGLHSSEISLAGTGTPTVSGTSRGGDDPPMQRWSPRFSGFFDVLAGGGGTDVTANPTGVAGTSAAGSLTVTGGATHTLSGVTGTGQVGSLTVTGAAAHALTGLSATGSLGSLTVTGGSSLTLTGVSATGSVGDITIETDGGVSITLTGVAATGALGSLTVTGGATVSLTGVSATGALGTLTVTGSASVALTGVEGSGAPGTISVSTDNTLNVTVTLSGVEATTSAGSVLIWGVITATQTPSWSALGASQTPLWTEIEP